MHNGSDERGVKVINYNNLIKNNLYDVVIFEEADNLTLNA